MGLLSTFREWLVTKWAARLAATMPRTPPAEVVRFTAKPEEGAPEPVVAPEVAEQPEAAPPPAVPPTEAAMHEAAAAAAKAQQPALPEGAEIPGEIRTGATLLAAFLKATGVGFPVALAVELIGGLLGGIAEDNWWLDHGKDVAMAAVDKMLRAAAAQGGAALRAEVAAEIDRRQVALYRQIWESSDPLWEALNGGHSQYLRLQAAKRGLLGTLNVDGTWAYVGYADGEPRTYDATPGSEAYDGKAPTQAEKEAAAAFREGVAKAREAQADALADLPEAAERVERAHPGMKPAVVKPAPAEVVPELPPIQAAAEVAQVAKEMPKPPPPLPELPKLPMPPPIRAPVWVELAGNVKPVMDDGAVRVIKGVRRV